MGGKADDARKRRERLAGSAHAGEDWVYQGQFRYRCNGPGVRNIVRGRVALGTHEAPLIEAAVGAYHLRNDLFVVCWPRKDGTPELWTDDGAAPCDRLARLHEEGASVSDLARRFETTEAHVVAAVDYRRFPWRPGHLTLRRPVLELGGGLGVSACRINRFLASPAEHLVVERDARLVPLLRESARANRAGFVALHAQAGLEAAPRRAGQAPGPPLPLEFLIDLAGAGRPVEVVCSIDGEEVHVLEEGIDALAAGCARLIVNLHPYRRHGGAGPAARLKAMLEDRGFVVVSRRVQTVAFIHPEVDANPIDEAPELPILMGAAVSDEDDEEDY